MTERPPRRYYRTYTKIYNPYYYIRAMKEAKRRYWLEGYPVDSAVRFLLS